MDPFVLKDDMYQKRAVANNLRDRIQAMGCYRITVGKTWPKRYSYARPLGSDLAKVIRRTEGTTVLQMRETDKYILRLSTILRGLYHVNNYTNQMM